MQSLSILFTSPKEKSKEGLWVGVGRKARSKAQGSEQRRGQNAASTHSLFMLLFLLGILANGFIVLVLSREWRRLGRLLPSDMILISLGACCFCLQWVGMVHNFLLLLLPPGGIQQGSCMAALCSPMGLAEFSHLLIRYLALSSFAWSYLTSPTLPSSGWSGGSQGQCPGFCWAFSWSPP